MLRLGAGRGYGAVVITRIDGVRVGHWTDHEARTGCTVVLFPDGTVASGEVRGGAPATRDFALLAPEMMVERLDAVVLSGGSAFGLASCTGVMAHLEQAGVGFETSGGRVPIVVGMSLYDLSVGDATVRPDAAAGRAAAEAASAGVVELGPVGAGTGATVSKWQDPEWSRPGGLGAASATVGDLVVAALVAVNASGDIDDGRTAAAIAAGTFAPSPVVPFENTTIGVVVTNAAVTKRDCHLMAHSAHDGYARALVPAHSSGDGDAVVVAATGAVDADLMTLRVLATDVVERAIRSVA